MLDSARVELQEAVYGLRHYRQRLDLDPERLRDCEQRIEAVHATARKHRVAPEALPQLLAEQAERLEALGAGLDSNALTAEEASARTAFFAAAERLSVLRREAAATLSARVSQAMQALAMRGGRFEVALEPVSGGGAHGLESVAFNVSPHRGAPLRPLAKIVSGGELSRLSLAVQTATSTVAQVPTLIFDEVDAGIGGGVAQIVGSMLRSLGQRHQVMCITHLPQVAACADHQWRVTRKETDRAARSQVKVLSPGERVEEIARMLGGVKITDTTRRHAAEMLASPGAR
jgi:DNA repair protein RecN (Recombination protein N)